MGDLVTQAAAVMMVFGAEGIEWRFLRYFVSIRELNRESSHLSDLRAKKLAAVTKQKKQQKNKQRKATTAKTS